MSRDSCGVEPGKGASADPKPQTLRGICREETPLEEGQPQGLILVCGERRYRLLDPSIEEARLACMAARQYVGLEVAVTGVVDGDSVRVAAIRLERIPGAGDITTLTVLITDEDLRLSCSAPAIAVDGTLSPGGGLYVKDGSAVLIGFEGDLAVPHTLDLTLHRHHEELDRERLRVFAPSLAARPHLLPAPPPAVRNVDEFMTLVRWATHPRDMDYFLGGYPDDNPHALGHLERVAQAERLHQLHRSLRRPRRCPTKEEAWVEIGGWLTEAITTSEAVAAQREPLWNGARRALIAPEELVRNTRALVEYRTRYEVTEQETTKALEVLEKRIEQRYKKAQAKGYQYEYTLAFGPAVGVFLALGASAAVVHRFSLLDRIEGKALMTGATAVACLSGLLGAAGGHEYQKRERAEELAGLQRDLEQLRDLREVAHQQYCEGSHHRSIGRVMEILAETHDKLKEQLEVHGNDPEMRQRYTEQAYDKLERRLREARAEKGGRGTVAEALVAGDWERYATLAMDSCERQNVFFNASRKAAAARTSALYRGFGSMQVPSPGNEPDWMWV